MEDVPSTMRSLVAPQKCSPKGYAVIEVDTPKITLPTQVLFRIHAAPIMTGDTQRAAGQLDILLATEYPLPLGMLAAGVVVAVGSEVKSIKVGDEVYGAVAPKPVGAAPPPGFVSEYGVAEEFCLMPKPPHLSFEEAASLLAPVATAQQTIRRGLQLRGEESLEGKTVFVPAGLSATGSVAIQVAKNVFGASKIITTVSTAKVKLVEEYLPGLVDQVIDYKTQRLQDHVPKGSVDFAYNTQFGTYDECISLLKPATGVLVSIASAPSKATARELIGKVPWWLGLVLDTVQAWYAWKVWGTGIRWEFVSGGLNKRELLEAAGEIIALGKVKAVMSVVGLDDIGAVQEASERVLNSKGGIGGLVVKTT